MYCRAVVITVRLFKALFIVLLGAAMTLNSMAMASMGHIQLQSMPHLMPQPAHSAAMHCHDTAQQASDLDSFDLNSQAQSGAGHAGKHACFDMLCCSPAMSPLRPVLRLQLSADSPVPQFFYTAQLQAGYFARPDPPPRPVI